MKTAVWMYLGVPALALSTIASTAVAQGNYPSAPIKIVWGYTPGATGDLVARLLAQNLSSQMNANVLVENKPGANGNISAELVAKSKPDGYTLLFNSPGLVVSRVIGEKLGYDLFKDLTPIARVASAPYFLVVTPALPANTVAEFIAYVRSHPDKLAYASSGNGSSPHLGTLLFLQAHGLTALHVPYKGTAPSMTDLAAGRIQFRFTDPKAALPMVKDKRLKAIAFAGLKRSPLMPELPTMVESGMPGFEVGTWFSMMAPANTPPAIVKRLSGEIVKALQNPEVKARLEQQGVGPTGSSPENYGAYLRSEAKRWGKVVKTAGIKAGN